MDAQVLWMTVFIDMPVADARRGAEFWSAVMGCEPSEWRGEEKQFATLLPTEGYTSHLRLQALDIAEPRIHLDLHVDDIASVARRAVGLGATEVLDAGYRVLRSPGGFHFCLVDYHGESDPGRVDQLCIDVPPARFDVECRFWSELLGLSLEPSSLDGFVALEHNDRLAVRLLLQRTGDDASHTDVRGHLDVSAGADVRSVVATHVALGAEEVAEHKWWTVMRDPIGHIYCVTHRDPLPGTR